MGSGGARGGWVATLTGPWAIDWAAPHVLLGHGFLLGASLSWALAMLVVRRWPPADRCSSCCRGRSLATAALLPMALAHEAGEWNGSAVVAMAAIGFVIAPVGTWCIMQATTSLPMIVASVGFLVGPALGVVLATLFLHEELGADMVAGTGLILAGAGLASTHGRAR